MKLIIEGQSIMQKLLILIFIFIISGCGDSSDVDKNNSDANKGNSSASNSGKHYYNIGDLKGMADQLNGSLPMQYDSVTVLKSVKVEDERVIQYHYNVDMDAMLTGMGKELNMSVSTVKSMVSKKGGLDSFFKEYIKNEYGAEIIRDDCSNAPLVKLLNDSVGFHHYFYDLDSNFISKVVVLKEYC